MKTGYRYVSFLFLTAALRGGAKTTSQLGLDSVIPRG
jgi:hypothetical protein